MEIGKKQTLESIRLHLLKYNTKTKNTQTIYKIYKTKSYNQYYLTLSHVINQVINFAQLLMVVSCLKKVFCFFLLREIIGMN